MLHDESGSDKLYKLIEELPTDWSGRIKGPIFAEMEDSIYANICTYVTARQRIVQDAVEGCPPGTLACRIQHLRRDAELIDSCFEQPDVEPPFDLFE